MIPLFLTTILRKPSFLIPFSFLIWIVSFWGFLSGRIALTSDAISYYGHTKFFIDQISLGQFPLWDPYWSGGVPNDFFLRRIGPYNPFYFIILLLSKLGVKFFYAYMIFQAIYFFLGMTGFYLLAKKLLKNRPAAFLSFLVLTFSVLGSRIFDSYMLLVTIPVIWFFYFLVSFFSLPRRAPVVGITFACMILLTTYIPLYFLVIFLSFIVVYVTLYWRGLGEILGCVWSFINKNRFFSALCLCALILSVLPGLSFFSDSGRGEIVIPGRHYNTEFKHVLTVEPQQLSPWSIVEEFFFSSYFTDLSRVVFAVVYVPFFALMVLAVGLFVRINRLFVFLCLWMLLLVLFSMPIGFPLYDFMYTHSGFVKYFRNLHFLLWFILLPVFALYVGVVWKQFKLFRRECPSWCLWVLIITVHCVTFILLLRQHNALLATFVSFFISGCVYVLLLAGFKRVHRWILILLLIAVVVQPVAVFHFLSHNYTKEKAEYSYDDISGSFSHTTALSGEVRASSAENISDVGFLGHSSVFYYTTDNYRRLSESVDLVALDRYEQYKFYLYDHQPAANGFSSAFLGEPVRADSDRFRVVKFGSTMISISVNLSVPKFIVFNDVNYPGWSLRVNGNPQAIVTANGAFKGFWLPAGKSSVVLQYGRMPVYLFNWLLMVVFYGMFIYIVLLYWRGRNEHS